MMKTRSQILHIAFVLLVGQAFAGEVRSFNHNAQLFVAEDVSAEILVFYQGLRLNEATGDWNVDLVLTNTGPRELLYPVFVSIESITNSSGLTSSDGASAGNKPFVAVTVNEDGTGSIFPVGGLSLARTIAMGFQAGAGLPQLQTLIFAAPAGLPYALALTRTLNGAGQPLSAVTVFEDGPAGSLELTSDPDYGVVTLGSISGNYVWRFERDGHLPVWRTLPLLQGAVRQVPNPRLVERTAVSNSIPAGVASTISNVTGQVFLDVSAATFSQPATVTLQQVDGQSLPGLLPQGWSPVNAFWFESTSEPDQPVSARLSPGAGVGVAETAALARWDDTVPAWRVVEPVTGAGTNEVTTSLPVAGAYALVVADPAPVAPPAAVVGQLLSASALPVQPDEQFVAAGSVAPSSSPASLAANQVTGMATVSVTNETGVLSSGLSLRAEVTETYQLLDSSIRLTAPYEVFLSGYRFHQGMTASSNTAHLSFSMRPLLLFGAEELAGASVLFRVLEPDGFLGEVFDDTGGSIADEDIQISAGPGDMTSPQAVSLRALFSEDLETLLTPDQTLAAAFDLTVTGVASNRFLSLQVSSLPTNTNYILARIVSDLGLHGLEPVERLQTDAAGVLQSLEPGVGARFPGLRRAGQYLLVEVAEAHGLVSGVIRDSGGQPVEGFPARITGTSWITVSMADGSYLLPAPVGTAEVAVFDPVTGDTDFAQISVTNPVGEVMTDLTSMPRGPRVIFVEPADSSTDVKLVAPVVLAFNEPLNPGTFGTDGVQLVDTNGPVAASLTLNLQGTVATLLPSTPLEPVMPHTLTISTNILGVDGMPLEGETAFSFTTESDALDRTGVELIIYEPGATNVPPEVLSNLVGFVAGADPSAVVVHGTSGAAEPGQPVILVNESSGEAATVLSLPDGSFYGFIQGDEEDLVTATIQNANGSRNVLPVNRQLFDDGFVGLYRQGGILEAESAGGMVEIFVEPGAISSKTQFRLETIPVAELLAILDNTPPETGQLIGAFQYEEDGPPLESAVDVTFPVEEVDLGLPGGVDPAEATFAMTIPRKYGDTVVYEIIDLAEYESTGPGTGQLVAKSPPFIGLLQRRLKALEEATDLPNAVSTNRFGIADEQPERVTQPDLSVVGFVSLSERDEATILGHVIAAEVDADGRPVDEDDVIPVVGAVVATDFVNQPREPGSFRQGEMVCISNEDGFFVFALEPSLQGASRLLRATHPRYAGQVAGPVPIPIFREQQDKKIFSAELLFALPVIAEGSIDGLAPPVVLPSHDPLFPPIGGDGAVLQILILDDVEAANAVVTVESVRALLGTEDLGANAVSIEDLGVEADSPARKLHSFRVIAVEPALATLHIEVVDANNNSVELLHAIPFGGTPPAGTGAPDPFGPRVVRVWPPQGSKRVSAYTPIELNFNEPLNQQSLGESPPTWLSMDENHSIAHIEVSGDGRKVTVFYRGLATGPVLLTVGTSLSDVGGTAFDQDFACSGNQPFNLTFNQASESKLALPKLKEGAGVVFKGAFSYALERDGVENGRLWAFELKDELEWGIVRKVEIDGRPSSMQLIPEYTLAAAASGDIIDCLERTDYLAVFSGGVTETKALNLVPVIMDDGHLELEDPIRGAISTSPASLIAKSKWDPPFLGYLELGADVTSVVLLDINAFVIGVQSDDELRATFDDVFVSGVDTNFDGDYCDGGAEVPPKPGINLVDPFGLAFSFAPNDFVERISDFDFSSNFGLLATVYERVDGSGPAGFRLVLGGTGLLPLQDAVVEFQDDDRPKRVLLLPGQQLVENGIEVIKDLALVSFGVTQNNPEGRIEVVDITVPNTPVVIGDPIVLPPGEGAANSIVLRADGMLVVAAGADSFILDPRSLLLPIGTNPLHPALVGGIVEFGGGMRDFVTDVSGVNIINAGSNQQMIQSPPHCEIVTYGGAMDLMTAFELSELSDPALIQAFVDELEPIDIAEAAILDGEEVPAPDKTTHYYVVIRAPGAAGEEIDVAMASLDASGMPLPSARANAVPTMLEDPSVVPMFQIKEIVRWAKDGLRSYSTFKNVFDTDPGTAIENLVRGTGAITEVLDSIVRFVNFWESYPTVIFAHRLVDEGNRESDLYNTYLAGPFVLLPRELEPSRLDELQDDLERHYLRAGSLVWAGPGIGFAQEYNIGRLSFSVFNIPLEFPIVPSVLPSFYVEKDQRDNPIIGRYTADLESAEDLLVDPTGEGGLSLIGQMIDDAAAIKQEWEGGNDPESAAIKSLEIALKYFSENFEPILTPGAFVQKPVAFQTRPLVFVPGIMGSDLWNADNENVWIHGQLLNQPPDFDSRLLNLDAAGESVDTSIEPGDITRKAFGIKDIYAPVLEFLVGDLGYVEYDYRSGEIDDEDAGAQPHEWHRRRTLVDSDAIPDLAQSPKPTLYVFPYDWRKDNTKSADKLGEYIDLVLEMHPEAEQIDLMAHSMGGLVSRTYILNGGDTKVARFITMGTPWLGAAKAINAMKHGDFDELAMNIIAPKPMLQRASIFVQGVHQLVPSKAQFDLGLNPLFEAGWDLNTNGVAYEVYDYDEYKEGMSEYLFDDVLKEELGEQFETSPVIVNHENLHIPELGDWRNDIFEIEYFHLIGIQSTALSPGRVALTRRFVPIPGTNNDVAVNFPALPIRESEDLTGVDTPDPATLNPNLPLGSRQYKLREGTEVVRTLGDGTVPLLSLSRGYKAGNLDLNDSEARVYPVVTLESANDEKLGSHNGMLGNPHTHEILRLILEGRPPPEVVVSLSGGGAVMEGESVTLTASVTPPDEAEGAPKYLWDFGDGGSDLTSSEIVAHIYLEDGSFIASCAVAYENGVAGFASVKVTVANADPVVTIENGDFDVLPGATPILVAKVEDPGLYDQHFFEWDFDNDGTIDFEGSFAAVPEFNTSGSQTVKLTVKDDGGGSGDATITVTVGQNDTYMPPPFMPSTNELVGGSQQRLDVRIGGQGRGLFGRSDGVTVWNGDDVSIFGVDIYPLQVTTEDVLVKAARVLENIRSANVQDISLLNLTLYREHEADEPLGSVVQTRLTGADRLVEIDALYSEGGVPQVRYTFEATVPASFPMPVIGAPGAISDAAVIQEFFTDDANLKFNWENETAEFEVLTGGSMMIDPKAVLKDIAAADRNGPSIALVRNPRTRRVFIIGRDDFTAEMDLEFFIGEDQDGDGDCTDDTFYQMAGRSFLEHALPSRPFALVARDLAGNVSRFDLAPIQTSSDVDFKHNVPGAPPDPNIEEDFCVLLEQIKAKVIQAIDESLAYSEVKRYLLDHDHLWILEQGSGACLWKNNHCDACRGAYRPKDSDNDYELLLPVHLENSFTNQTDFIASDPYSDENMQGDWYFKIPRALIGTNEVDPILDNGVVNTNVEKWVYILPGEFTNQAGEAEIEVDRPMVQTDDNPFFSPVTPAEIIAFYFTFVTATNTNVRAFLPEVSYFPFRREHFQYAAMSVEKPPPFGDDPIGDAGMGRHLLLLKWVLEGAYVNHGINTGAEDLGNVYANLCARGMPVADGYEWGVYQDFAALLAGARLRVERNDLPAVVPRSNVRDWFGGKDRKIVKKVGKAAIRATMGGIAGDPATAGLALSKDPAQYLAAGYPTFEHFIADIATNGGPYATEADLVSGFIRAKAGDKGFINGLIDDPDGVRNFIQDAFLFIRDTVQSNTQDTYSDYLGDLLDNGLINEHRRRVQNVIDLEFDFVSGGKEFTGRQKHRGNDGGTDLHHEFVVSIMNYGTNELDGLEVTIGPPSGGGSGGGGVTPNVFVGGYTTNIGAVASNTATTILMGEDDPDNFRAPVGTINTADTGEKTVEVTFSGDTQGHPSDPPDENDKATITAQILNDVGTTTFEEPATFWVDVVPDTGPEFLLRDYPARNGVPRSPAALIRATDRLRITALGPPNKTYSALVTISTNDGFTVALAAPSPDDTYYVGEFGITNGLTPTLGFLPVTDEELLRVGLVGPGAGSNILEVLIDRAEMATVGLMFTTNSSGPEPRVLFRDSMLNDIGYHSAGDLETDDDVGAQGLGNFNDFGRFMEDFGANIPGSGEADLMFALAHGDLDGHLADDSPLQNTILFPEVHLVDPGIWSADADFLILMACNTLNATNVPFAGRDNWLQVLQASGQLRTILGFHQPANKNGFNQLAGFLSRADTESVAGSWIHGMELTGFVDGVPVGIQPWALWTFLANEKDTLTRLTPRVDRSSNLLYLNSSNLVSVINCELGPEDCCGDSYRDVLAGGKVLLMEHYEDVPPEIVDAPDRLALSEYPLTRKDSRFRSMERNSTGLQEIKLLRTDLLTRSVEGMAYGERCALDCLDKHLDVGTDQLRLVQASTISGSIHEADGTVIPYTHGYTFWYEHLWFGVPVVRDYVKVAVRGDKLTEIQGRMRQPPAARQPVRRRSLQDPLEILSTNIYAVREAMGNAEALAVSRAQLNWLPEDGPLHVHADKSGRYRLAWGITVLPRGGTLHENFSHTLWFDAETGEWLPGIEVDQ